jgi:thiamine-phosphate pyrophosphorylase
MIPEWLVYLITDRHQVDARGLPLAVTEAIRGGIRAVQLREKDLPLRTLLPLAADLRVLTAQHGVHLLINGRIDVMQAVDADGVHLRTDGLPAHAVRRVIGPGKLLGVSTHSLREVEQAARGGADFVTFGPVFATPSKAAYGAPTGVRQLEAVCRRAQVPVYALGGITRVRIPEVMAAGAHGVALIAEIMSSRDIEAAARSCLDAAFHAASRRSVDPGWGEC